MPMDQAQDIPVWNSQGAQCENYANTAEQLTSNHGNRTECEVTDGGWSSSSQTVTVGNWSSWQPVTSLDVGVNQFDEAMDEVEEQEDPDKFVEGSPKVYAVQMSPEQFQKQTTEYTKAAVQELLKSPEYIRRHTTCRMCWSVWSEGMVTQSCPECGGFAMQRPCPVCLGKCGSVWSREVEMSHDHSAAHWDGACLLPDEEREAYMLQTLSEDASEDTVLEALQGLTT